MIGFLAFLAVIGLLRVVELVISKKNWRRHQDKASLLEEPLFRWMVLLHASFFVLIPAELFISGGSFGSVVSIIGMVMTGLALLLRFWTLRTIGSSWNVRVVYAEDYPIVHNGPYRFIRHPNYLVVILELAFIPLIYELYISAILLSLLNAMVLNRRISNEEAVLFKNPQWVVHMADKPRFFPFLSK